MAFRFRLQGKGLRHSWEKECAPKAALVHAEQVAREYANDDLYHGTTIGVLNESGDEVARIAVTERSRAPRK